MSDPKWTHFGWQGIEFEIPADWTLGKLDGNRGAGYLRIDDETMARIEAKWETTKSREYDIAREMERQLRDIEKRARKAKIDLAVKRNVKMVRLQDRRWECAFWKGDPSAYSMLTQCEDCGRIVLLRVMFREHEPGKDWACRVFQSLVDHHEDCRDHWDVFGLSVKVPADFALGHASLKTGEIRLPFIRAGESLEAVRVSLGQYQLRSTSLDEWFEKFCRKELEPYKWAKEPCKVREHPGFCFQGPRRLQKRLLAPFNTCSLKSRVWYCKETDKLFILRSILRPKHSDVFEQVCTTVQCH